VSKNLIRVWFVLFSAWSFRSKEGIDEGYGGESINSGNVP